jgi:hypothetical protein
MTGFEFEGFNWGSTSPCELDVRGKHSDSAMYLILSYASSYDIAYSLASDAIHSSMQASRSELLVEVACETTSKTGVIILFGELNTKAQLDYY